MKAHLQILFLLALISLMVIAGCGPEPNPKLQAKSAETPEHNAPAPAAPPAAAPAPEPQPAAVAPVARPARPVAAAPAPKPKRQPVTKADAAVPASAPRPASAPAGSTASATPGTLTLPAPVAPAVTVPPAPVDEVKPEHVEPPPPRQITVPSGTLVAVRMIDSVDSETARQGETFKGSLDAPIVVDNETVFPKGSEVYVKLSKVESAGRVSGRSEIQLQLDRILVGRKSYLLSSSTYVTTGASQAGRTAKTAGIGAAIGAAIGAISGGGKGAVIGGATGAGAGAGVEAIRKGDQVRVDSETRLDFRLEDSLEVTLQSPSSSTPQRNNPSGPPRFGTRQ
jgi:hypothetical protein